ncbi:hypothetical protein [Chitinophaga sp. YR627]|uniref:hypothetical protein n=1 Tax=Chitinophaga sp. YR627 TaxID=1881041 RepID=UPI000B7F687C|nr:hypothetical protein [Chitinophaga sp. YR627]
MNAVGFFKTHHPDVKCSKDINDFFSNEAINEVELSMIVSYLEKGVPVISLISDLYEEGERIGPNIIYSDGLWIWPSYYSVYLKKYPRLTIPDEFIQHVKLNKDKPLGLSLIERKYTQYLLTKLLYIRLATGFKLPEDVDEMVNIRGEVIQCY